MRHDFHEAPFGPSTLVKLALFEGYFAKWLPVFLHLVPQPSQINVVDFFSGPGEDVEHTPGSPLLLLKQLRIFKASLGPWYGKINVIFNDADQEKTERLETLLAEKFKDVLQYARVTVHSQEFTDLYTELLPGLSEPTAANLLFVDQTGVRELGEDTFRSIVALPMTDLLFFVSSSTVERFHHVEEVHRLLPIPEDIIHATPHYRVHKMVRSYYESLLRPDQKYYLGDFSLRREQNIYGLIFGSNSLRGLEKFVATCWGIDSKTGEANYSIDGEDLDNPTPSLFGFKPLKIEAFERALRKLLLDHRLTNNWEILEYSLRNGMLGKHAKAVLRALVNEGILEEVIPLSFDSVKDGIRSVRFKPRKGVK